MATAKLYSEMPLLLPPHLLSIPSRKSSFSVFFLKPFSSSLHPTTKLPRKATQVPNFSSGIPDHSSSWLKKWPSTSPLPPIHYKKPRTLQQESTSEAQFLDEAVKPPTSAIDRIVLRLRNLGLGSDDEDEEGVEETGSGVEQVTGEEKLGDLLKRDWVRPDKMLLEDEEESDSMSLPWERSAEEGAIKDDKEEGSRTKRRSVKAPTLAELTIEDGELRRLRRMGMTLRERINVPKAGVTKEVLEKIHDKWRKNELVRLKFHEDLAHDMRTGHEIVEVCGLSPNFSNWIIQ